jgi:hypothetical protein
MLSVLGTETERWFVDSHELLHSWFPQLEDCRIEGVAHLLHIQRPEPVARGVAEFFARHPITRDRTTKAVCRAVLRHVNGASAPERLSEMTTTKSNSRTAKEASHARCTP